MKLHRKRWKICTCVNDLNTTFIEESGFRPQQRSMSLSLFKDDFCFLHARENLSSEPDFRWLFWQSSTWKLVKLSGTRWTWIFSKSNTIANRTKKSHFTVVKNSWKCLISIFKRKFKFLKKRVKFWRHNSRTFKCNLCPQWHEPFLVILKHCAGVLLEEENAIENYSRRSWRQQHMVQ